MSHIDCILISGGGLLPDGNLPPWTIARLNRALELSDRARYIACLSGGTVHKPPPLDRDGYPIFESRVAGSYLANQEVEPNRILTEISSYDTIGNAYFSRLLFSDPMGFQRLLVITSEFHLPRAQVAFDWIYNLTPLESQHQIEFEGTPDLGLSPAGLKARSERERQSLVNLRSTKRDLTTLEAFQSWFYSEHAAYAVQFRPERLENSDALESY